MSKQQRQFKKGDRVTWSSSANGNTVQKTGLVIEVVPAGSLVTTNGFGFATRDHESYIVTVPQPASKRGPRPDKLYWPRAAALRSVRGRKPGSGHPLYWPVT